MSPWLYNILVLSPFHQLLQVIYAGFRNQSCLKNLSLSLIKFINKVKVQSRLYVKVGLHLPIINYHIRFFLSLMKTIYSYSAQQVKLRH